MSTRNHFPNPYPIAPPMAPPVIEITNCSRSNPFCLPLASRKPCVETEVKPCDKATTAPTKPPIPTESIPPKKPPEKEPTYSSTPFGFRGLVWRYSIASMTTFVATRMTTPSRTINRSNSHSCPRRSHTLDFSAAEIMPCEVDLPVVNRETEVRGIAGTLFEERFRNRSSLEIIMEGGWRLPVRLDRGCWNSPSRPCPRSDWDPSSGGHPDTSGA